jgi:hypothetical protein
MRQTRAEWQAQQDERQRRLGTWGFDPEMPWRVANWKERLGIVFFYGFMWGIVFPGMFVGALLVFGMMIDGHDRYHEEHDRCMKHAHSGYEIEQCH